MGHCRVDDPEAPSASLPCRRRRRDIAQPRSGGARSRSVIRVSPHRDYIARRSRIVAGAKSPPGSCRIRPAFTTLNNALCTSRPASAK